MPSEPWNYWQERCLLAEATMREALEEMREAQRERDDLKVELALIRADRAKPGSEGLGADLPERA
jgi:hypothetical protein